jgi:hypothetical protein
MIVEGEFVEKLDYFREDPLNYVPSTINLKLRKFKDLSKHLTKLMILNLLIHKLSEPSNSHKNLKNKNLLYKILNQNKNKKTQKKNHIFNVLHYEKLIKNNKKMKFSLLWEIKYPSKLNK